MRFAATVNRRSRKEERLEARDPELSCPDQSRTRGRQAVQRNIGEVVGRHGAKTQILHRAARCQA
jgi:hypothetical protein